MVGGIRAAAVPSKKRRFLYGVKILLDVAKESADALPPLKSCLGGISAIIKHYDESKDVKDNLSGLISWVTVLKDKLTEAVSDPKEAERREQLKRCLVDVENTSRALLDKRPPARILDKTRDLGIVIKLVEEVTQALLIYKASQQQSIHDQVAQLATSFGAFMKINEPRFPEVKTIASVLERLHRFRQLVPDPISGDGKVNDNESKRCTKLVASLMKIEIELRPLSNRFAGDDYEFTAEDRQIVDDLTEDIRDAAHEYQLSQQKEIYEQNRALIGFADLDALNSIERARGAGYNHRDRHGCLKGTRVVLLDKIEQWANDRSRLPILWLSGLAGTGKSTIAKTVAERCFADGTLGASFFFSGDTALQNHNDPGMVFPTLAFQLAHKYPNFRSTLVPHLRSDPDIGCEPLKNQAEELLIKPFLSANVATVIVVDGLDECKGNDSSSAILSSLEKIVKRAPGVKFFITSRPEPQTKNRFRHLTDVIEVLALHDAVSDQTNNDIRVFLEHELSGLAARKGLSNWPAAAQLDLLCDRATRLFAFAVATVKFLSNSPRMPDKRYSIIEGSKDKTIHEGTMKGVHGGLSLDSLCISIFHASFPCDSAEDNAVVRSVIAAALSSPPFPPSTIPKAVHTQTGESVEIEEVMRILKSVHSLLEIREEEQNQPVRPFHKLLPDCLTDPARCSDKNFLIVRNHAIPS